jgi:hypothetical protein
MLRLIWSEEYEVLHDLVEDVAAVVGYYFFAVEGFLDHRQFAFYLQLLFVIHIFQEGSFSEDLHEVFVDFVAFVDEHLQPHQFLFVNVAQSANES